MGTAENLAQLRGFDSYEVQLGDELRGERATLGKSLLDVQRDLRIKASYIAAIENCDVAVFPNQGFVAGYVRSYARYLKLDPESVFQRFCEESRFGGVNAGLTAQKKSSGKIVASGPVKVAKDDPLLKPLRPAQDYRPGLTERVSISAIGSVLVLMVLLVGLGYGGMSVLRSIQRVEIVPVDQRPETLSEIGSIENPIGDGEEIALTTVGAPATAPSDLDLSRLYQPRELEVPVLESRDGPILDIDPDSTGLLASVSAPSVAGPPGLEQVDGYVDAQRRLQVAEAQPQVREEVAFPVVNVVARQPAWVRIYLADGNVLFEKILQTGETYTLPLDVEAPLLRAGNSGSVYLLVNDAAYGPVGRGTSVAKNVSLVPTDIAVAFAQVQELPDEIQAIVSALAID